MNPRIPDILSRVLEAAAHTLERPDGSPRRRDGIEQLFEDVHEAKDWATDQPRRFVNDWTALLVTMLRKIERAGPFGDTDELARAETVARALLEYVQADALAAMRVKAATSNQSAGGGRYE